MNRSNSIALLLLIIGLIFFDAAQQKYYIERFDLNQSGEAISYLDLIINHLTRWTIWLICSIPYLLVLRTTFKRELKIGAKKMTAFGSIIGITVIASLVFISLETIASQAIPFSLDVLFEIFLFYVFQKGLSFIITSVLVTLLTLNYYKSRSIDAQEVEIRHLKRHNDELSELFQSDTQPHLEVKTGYKLKPIPLEEIVWIQSDDYCVKVHTEDKTYTLRQSLKFLESKLAPFKFVRIHRGALLNLSYIDQINYNKSTIRLKNTSEIPFSKNGMKSLKQQLSADSI